MTALTTPLKLRRILVALDAAERSGRALEEAARLAAGLQAELVGLFVEDSDLLAAAALPVTRLLPSQGHGAGLFDSAFMERALRVWSSEARKALETTAARYQVRCSFQVTRGLMSEALLALAGETDLLTFETDRRLRGTRSASTAHQVVTRGHCSLFLMQRRSLPGRPVAVVYDGTEQVLLVGRKLAEIYRVGIHVLVPDAARAAQAETLLGDDRAAARIEVLAFSDGAALAAALDRLKPGIVVTQRRTAASEAVAAAVEGGDSSLLMVG